MLGVQDQKACMLKFNACKEGIFLVLQTSNKSVGIPEKKVFINNED